MTDLLVLLHISCVKLLRRHADEPERGEEVLHSVYDLLQKRFAIQMWNLSLPMRLRVLKLLKGLEHLLNTLECDVPEEDLRFLLRHIDGPLRVISLESIAEELHELLTKPEHLLEFVS